MQALSKQEAYNLKLQFEYEYQHQNELIDTYSNKIFSENYQEKLAAKEFFETFPFQREVCDKFLKILNEEL